MIYFLFLPLMFLFFYTLEFIKFQKIKKIAPFKSRNRLPENQNATFSRILKVFFYFAQAREVCENNFGLLNCFSPHGNSKNHLLVGNPNQPVRSVFFFFLN